MLSSHTVRMGRAQSQCSDWNRPCFWSPTLNVASSIHSFTRKGLPQRIFEERGRAQWFTSNLPGIVTMGVPAQRTSIPVVCPLQSGVSRQTSASWPLLTCSSLGATGEKMIRFWGRPMFWAYCWMLGSPTAGKRNNHSTLLGTRFRI